MHSERHVSCECFLSAWKAWGTQTWVRSGKASFCTQKRLRRRSRNPPPLCREEEARTGLRMGVGMPKQWVRSSCRWGPAQSSLVLPRGANRVPSREESSRNLPAH